MASLWAAIKQKFNPVQEEIARNNGSTHSSNQTKIVTISKAYELVEVVNRGINLLVDNASLVDFDVKSSLKFTGQHGASIKQPTLDRLLNYRPNPYMDINTFRRLLLMDFLVDGNAFIHFDGTSLYHIPAKDMEVILDDKTYINHFKYGDHRFSTREIIFIKDNSVRDGFRGQSRINSALESLYSRESMLGFQKSFFENGAAVGLIIESEQLISAKLKKRKELEWMADYNPVNGGGKPIILDNGMKAKSISNANFKEMAFTESIKELEYKSAMAMGIPSLLLDSGNNANIKPNLELLFYLTILPMMRKFESAFEYFFAFDIETTTHKVPALRPDQKIEAERVSVLVNNGLITGDEGRQILRYAPLDTPEMTKIRIPANIAGSGTGVVGQEGGAPEEEENND